ncbi:ATP-dependent Clp protease ATP-binding subunit [Acidaminobacter sp. JC074]|uniref:ATP-dependent Clp protease ATP-binding subunit n=1 Tax=Acidaminobacter sp. JC074 TaxID=2530199 RepID=UPI001F0F660F|nr:ATP-dependent Clp protease ATP-binding subunit [Acidaminobacter sp. JC074]MCH4890449.1 ATP-dependent Clp protease ATP-binding subunit [Acidaminobacter sp. JC074]
MELYDNYSDKAKMILDQAFTEVRSMNMNYVGSEHLLLSLLKVKSDIVDTIKRYNQLTYKDVKKECLRYVGIGLVEREIQGYSRRASEILRLASHEANALKSLKVEPEHMMLALLDQNEATAVKVLEKIGFSAFDLKTDIIRELDLIEKKAKKAKKEKIQASLIDSYGICMTDMAKENKYDPLIGRDEEVKRAIQILGRRTKNNPCLIGQPGVGKTAIAEGISRAIVSGNVPDYLLDKKIVSINLASLLAGSKFRGEFEDRLTQLIKEVRQDKKIILFIDEIHTLVGAGATQGAMDASNVLKPFLSRDDIRLIGATTISEYRKHIEKDQALERRLQPILIHEPSEEVCIDMLKGLKSVYESYHGIAIEDQALTASVKLSNQYIHDRFLPDKALDILDEGASRCRLNKVETLTADYIYEIVALWTGIPVGRLTTESMTELKKLEDTLSSRVIGQDEAVRGVSKSIIRSRVGLSDQSRPLGTYIFLGTTGVGKTELAKALAEALFGSEKDLIRIDMSEYMEKHAVSKLIGAPPGYVAYEEGGQLTEKIRTKPFSVVLFDELEKAHPDVLNLLLQMLDEGILTDGQGRSVSFKNTVLIFTSNIGTDKINKKTIGFSSDPIEFEASLIEDLKKSLKTEFINRIDEIIVFNKLEKEAVLKIIDMLLDKLVSRVSSLGYEFEICDRVKEMIYDKGYSEVYGVRSLKRTIVKLLENPLAEFLLTYQHEKGAVIEACLDEEGIKILQKC